MGEWTEWTRAVGRDISAARPPAFIPTGTPHRCAALGQVAASHARAEPRVTKEEQKPKQSDFTSLKKQKRNSTLFLKCNS